MIPTWQVRRPRPRGRQPVCAHRAGEGEPSSSPPRDAPPEPTPLCYHVRAVGVCACAPGYVCLTHVTKCGKCCFFFNFRSFSGFINCNGLGDKHARCLSPVAEGGWNSLGPPAHRRRWLAGPGLCRARAPLRCNSRKAGEVGETVVQLAGLCLSLFNDQPEMNRSPGPAPHAAEGRRPHGR